MTYSERLKWELLGVISEVSSTLFIRLFYTILNPQKQYVGGRQLAVDCYVNLQKSDWRNHKV